MKKIMISSMVLLSLVALMATPVMAGKSSDVIAKSNGFPSGPHFNMIIHGKDASVFTCDSTLVGGKSIFVPEYTTEDLNGDAAGEVSIQYIQNKKASLIDLLVLDSCAMDGLAKVQLPDKVMLDDGSTLPTNGFWVYAKIAGKPNNGPTPEIVSNIILYPNQILSACNDPGNPDFGTYTQCPKEDPEVALGVIWQDNLYTPDPETGDFKRFDPLATGGKGRSMGKDITPLFVYTGWVVDARLDLNGDDVINEIDVPGGLTDLNADLIIDQADLDIWLGQQTGMAWYFNEAWMHDIADLVITEQGLTNMGAKTLQVRFYPRSTTTFH